ncbi:hypothetical protein ACOLIX_003499 [Edwardsiella piscicida]|uniref:hypothetical protein n=1 Tax=Edwardsiella piscicida TaxID=1263550 RepID=UPI001C885F9B|nr:hypothetical protein [Edwardsiella piscicida]
MFDININITNIKVIKSDSHNSGDGNASKKEIGFLEVFGELIVAWSLTLAKVINTLLN